MADKFTELMEREKTQLVSQLPIYINPDRWFALALELRKFMEGSKRCTPESLYKAASDVARWGLEIGEDVYIIPYYNKDLKAYEAQAQPSYRGLMYRAIEAGVCAHMYAEVVRDGDTFEFVSGSKRAVTHVPLGKGDKLVAAYSVATLANGIQDIEVLYPRDVDEIKAQAIRMNERAGGQGLGPAWKAFEGEMWKAKVIKRHCKRLRGKREGNADAAIRYAEVINARSPFDDAVETTATRLDEPRSEDSNPPHNGKETGGGVDGETGRSSPLAATPEPPSVKRQKIAATDIARLKSLADDLAPSQIDKILEEHGAHHWKELYADQVESVMQRLSEAA